jgi:hypothetical protein
MKKHALDIDDETAEVMHYPQVRKSEGRLQERLDGKAEKKARNQKGTVAELKKILNSMKDQDVLVSSFGYNDAIKQVVPTIIDVLVYGKGRSYGEEIIEYTGDPRDHGYETMDELTKDGGKIIKALVFR